MKKSNFLVFITAGIMSAFAFSGCGRSEQDYGSESSLPIASEEQESTEHEVSGKAAVESNDYIGYWHMSGVGENELAIRSVDENEAVFSLWYYSTASFDDVHARLEGNTAYFETNDFAGSLTFQDGSVRLLVTMSAVSGVPSNYEEIYDERVFDSVREQNEGFLNDKDDAVKITELESPQYGRITCSGLTVGGVELSYLQGGAYSAVRKSLGDGWHIVSERTCFSYGILWYECYDSQDGDYYGWVDSEYITFGVETEVYSGSGSIIEVVEEPTSAANKPTVTQKPAVTQKPTVPPPTETKTQPSVQSPEASVNVITEQINGVTFNYIDSYYCYYDDIDRLYQHDAEVTINYCKPEDYITDDSHIIGLFTNDDVFEKEEIGSLYYTYFQSNEKDIAVFEVNIKGSYSGADTYYEGGILSFSRYTPYDVIVKSFNGKTKCIAVNADKESGDMDETVYIVVNTGQVSRIDLIICGEDPGLY